MPSKIFRKIIGKLGFDPYSRLKIQQRSDLVKIGTDYGGWVIPKDLLKPGAICYCVGCGEDISFDLALIEQFNGRVYGFDPTPRAITFVESQTKDNPSYQFFPLGLWHQSDVLKFYVPENSEHVSHSLVNLQKTQDYIEVQVERLKQIMQNSGHASLDLLKIDIEGAEYEVIKTIVADQLDIHILCIEFDECNKPLDENFSERIRQAVTRLHQIEYQLVNIDQRSNYTFVQKKYLDSPI